jgi:hypothetical protein
MADCENNDYSLYLGKLDYNTNEYFYFNGTIDDVAIYNMSLGAAQIKALYENRTDLIVSDETGIDETWEAVVIPIDNFEDGEAVLSNNVTIVNTPPVVHNVILNATDHPNNYTTANLTLYVNVTDSDGDTDFKYIVSWFRNDEPLALLNMPFENTVSNEKAVDYSGYGHDGAEYNGVTWGSSYGYDSKGGYYFDGANDYINITTSINEDFDEFSYSFWVNPTSSTNNQDLIMTYEADTTIRSFVGIRSYGIIIYQSNPSAYYFSTSTNNLVQGGWNHVVATFYNKDYNVYINGEKQEGNYVGPQISTYRIEPNWYLGSRKGAST